MMAGARSALQSAKLRRPALLRYAHQAEVYRFRGGVPVSVDSGLSANSGVDVMGHFRKSDVDSYP
jgi:hypothetical protein